MLVSYVRGTLSLSTIDTCFHVETMVGLWILCNPAHQQYILFPHIHSGSLKKDLTTVYSILRIMGVYSLFKTRK